MARGSTPSCPTNSEFKEEVQDETQAQARDRRAKRKGTLAPRRSSRLLPGRAGFDSLASHTNLSGVGVKVTQQALTLREAGSIPVPPTIANHRSSLSDSLSVSSFWDRPKAGQRSLKPRMHVRLVLPELLTPARGKATDLPASEGSLIPDNLNRTWTCALACDPRKGFVC